MTEEITKLMGMPRELLIEVTMKVNTEFDLKTLTGSNLAWETILELSQAAAKLITSREVADTIAMMNQVVAEASFPKQVKELGHISVAKRTNLRRAFSPSTSQRAADRPSPRQMGNFLSISQAKAKAHPHTG